MVVSKIFFAFTRKLGEDDPIWLYHIFQMGWNHQPVFHVRYTLSFTQKQGASFDFLSSRCWKWMKVGQKDTSDSEELLTQWDCSCGKICPSLTQLPNLIHSLCNHSLQTPKPDTPEDPKPMDTKPEKPEESKRNCLRFPFNRPLSLRGARMGKTLGVVPGCEIMCGSH